jgi:NodT family efflux transporter outer membrane factor (OMF) lipoprotein
MFTSAIDRERAAQLRPWLAVAMAAALLLSACAVGPNFSRPGPPRVERYGAAPPPARVEADGSAQVIELGRSPGASWWRLFGSSALDGLVSEGLAKSPTLASARAALLQSQDQARAGAGVFYPSVDAAFDATRARFTPLEIGSRAPASTFNLFTLTGSINYAVDLFGGERRSVEALRAAAERQRYAVGSAFLLLTGNIVDAAIARAAYMAQGDVLDRIIQVESDQRNVLLAQYNAGTIGWSAVLELDQQLGADRASAAAVRQRQAAATSLLSVLIGREPGEVVPAAPTLTDLTVPAEAPVSLPSQIVRERPDILQAEASLHQASADVGVATAALFPTITLTGEYGGVSTMLGQLGSAAGRFWSVGPHVDVPLFEGGTRWYGRKAALAAYVQAEDDYRQTVLAALEQVADVLKAVDADAKMAAAARSAFEAANLASTLSRTNGQAGLLADYDVMTSELLADRARLNLISAQSQRLQDVVALYLASGGGWAAAEADRQAANGSSK